MKNEPKDLTQYHYKAMESFFNFLKYEDEEQLMEDLNSIERHWKSWDGIQETEKSMWFRFYKNYTLATTIQDIKTDLHSPNREHIIACIRVCCELAEIEVYFS